MHLRLACFQCESGVGDRSVLVEFEDRGVYRFVCRNGHGSVHLLANPKFEILFEMGLLAFSDGYAREAVATLAASAEEFFRFFINLVLAKHQFDRNPKWYELKPFWKIVSRAEPQLGAFTALYMIEKGAAPSYPDQRSIQFRNDVIHRGRVPKLSDVESYGDKLLKFICSLYADYRMTDAFLFATAYDRLQELQTNPEPMNASTSYATAIGNLLAASGVPTFARAVEFARTGGFLKTRAT